MKALLLAVLLAVGTPAVYAEAAALKSPAQQALQAMTPAMAQQKLQEGNDRFVNQKMATYNYKQQVAATAGGQYPYAAILSCIDSRVPIETVFDAGIGDVFVARVAGNFANTDILGSLEYATKVVGSKLIVVLGHTECGAVKGAIDDVKLGNITPMLANLKPAVDRAKEKLGTEASKMDKKALVKETIMENVNLTMAKIKAESPTIYEQIQNGEIKVVGAVYDVHTGKVTFIE